MKGTSGSTVNHVTDVVKFPKIMMIRFLLDTSLLGCVSLWEVQIVQEIFVQGRFGTLTAFASPALALAFAEVGVC